MSESLIYATVSVGPSASEERNERPALLPGREETENTCFCTLWFH